jgi:hypothetical protein
MPDEDERMTKHFDKGYALVIGTANYPNIRKLSEKVSQDAKKRRNINLTKC